MKKVILLFVAIIFLCACSDNKIEDEYANFKHYSSSDFKVALYYSNYVIANIPTNSESPEICVLLYMIGKDDYIFIGNITDATVVLNKSKVYLYENKLYVLPQTMPVPLECVIDGLSIKEKDYKEYNTSKIDKNRIYFTSIEKVDKDNIYFKGETMVDNKTFSNIKCSKDTYICELAE